MFLVVGDGRESIGPKIDLLTYAKNEWRGDTEKARAILQVCGFLYYIVLTIDN